MFTKKLVFLAWIIIPVIAGCSMFRAAPVQEVKGKKIVLVLYNENAFKNEVTGKLNEALAGKGYKVVTGNYKLTKHYNSSDYGAVVYMAELWAWHTPWHAKKYFRKNKESGNMVFVITSGNPKVKITKPFDAVTTASKSEKVEPVTQEILARLENILR